MSRKNRRFPFERAEHGVVLPDHPQSSSDQLYPILRDYLSVTRATPSNEKQQPKPRALPPADPSRLNDFLEHLQQTRQPSVVDPNDFARLRQDDLQYWKSVREKWQNYYREENKREEMRFSHMSSAR